MKVIPKDAEIITRKQNRSYHLRTDESFTCPRTSAMRKWVQLRQWWLSRGSFIHHDRESLLNLPLMMRTDLSTAAPIITCARLCIIRIQYPIGRGRLRDLRNVRWQRMSRWNSLHLTWNVNLTNNANDLRYRKKSSIIIRVCNGLHQFMRRLRHAK